MCMCCSFVFCVSFVIMLEMYVNVYSPPWRCSPTRDMASSFLMRFLDHTQRRTTVGRTLLWTSDQPVAETSTWQHTTLTTKKHPCPRRDSNPNLSRWAVADLSFRPPGHGDRRACGIDIQFYVTYIVMGCEATFFGICLPTFLNICCFPLQNHCYILKIVITGSSETLLRTYTAFVPKYRNMILITVRTSSLKRPWMYSVICLSDGQIRRTNCTN